MGIGKLSNVIFLYSVTHFLIVKNILYNCKEFGFRSPRNKFI